MGFYQEPPRLQNQLTDDSLLTEYLARTLPPDALAQVQDPLHELGELAGGRLYELQLHDRHNEPRLTQWNAWGRRVDQIEVTPLWHEAATLAARHGLVAAAYERQHGEHLQELCGQGHFSLPARRRRGRSRTPRHTPVRTDSPPSAADSATSWSRV